MIVCMSDFISVAVSLAGWVGALVTIGAYGMVTSGRVAPGSLMFQGLNVFGASALALSASVNGAWPSAVTNLIWVGIGVHAVLSIKRTGLAAARRSMGKALQQAAAGLLARLDGSSSLAYRGTHH